MKKEENLTNDVIFKMFFKRRLDYLTLVINNILKLNIKEEDITFTDTELKGEYSDQKGTVLDLKVKLSNDEVIYIEMQNVVPDTYGLRMGYYNSKVLLNQLKRGSVYGKLNRSYGIFFINQDHKYFNKEYTNLGMCDKINYRSYEEYPIENHVINIKKLKDINGFDKKMEKLLKYMNEISDLGWDKMNKEDEVYQEIDDEVSKIKASEAYQDYLFAVEKAWMDQEEMKNQLIRDTKKEVTEQVTKQVTKEVTEQGKKDIALNMLAKNMDIDMISEITGLSVEKINSYKEE